MLGISRWAEKGGSYRTIQRFFNGTYDWSKLRWALIKQYLTIKGTGSVWLIAGDEVVVTKSGKQTHGLAKFYSSLQKQPVAGLCFLNLSLINVETRQCYPLVAEQLVRDEVKETAPKAVQKKADTGKAGRPKDSKNKNRSEVEFSAFQLQLQGCIQQALLLLGCDIRPCYFLYDGALGNNAGLQLVKQKGLHLISKLRHDSQLYFQHTGPYAGRGAPKKYGERLTLERLTDQYLCLKTVEKNSETCFYQVPLRHKHFPDLLNVVVIVKTNLTTGKSAKVLLFSDDLDLAYDQLVAYYQLRFQIEFNFRDAKQYWGLEDFMNVKEGQVRDICAVTLSKFTGEKGADISSQNIYLGVAQARHLKILDAEYQKNSLEPIFRQRNTFDGIIGFYCGTPRYDFNPFFESESAEPVNASARCVPLSHGLVP